MTEMTGKPAEQFPALTGLRFLAAFHVMMFHFANPEAWKVPAPLRALGLAGPAAVTLFFVLSGFVLTHTYRAPGREPVKGTVMYAARFARIWPVYALSWVLSAPLWLGFLWKTVGPPQAGTLWLVHGVASGLGIQAWLPPLALTWNPPAWSVGVELFFYACFPLLSAALVRCKTTTAIAVGVLAWLLGLLAPAWYVLASPVEDPVVHAARNFVDFFPPLRLPDFILGVVAARLWHTHDGLRRHSTALSWLGLGTTLLLTGSGLFPERVLVNGLLAPAFACLVVGLAGGTGGLARVLSLRPMQHLGDASYAMYLLHMPVIFWCAALSKHVSPDGILKDPSFTVPLLLLVIAVSLAVHRFVEVPARRALRPRLEGWARGSGGGV
jgi:peptidoglycan/LPS O-acetylase OafA/YrhL